MALRDKLQRFIDHETTRAEQATIGYLDTATGQYVVDAPGNDGYVFITHGGRDGYGGVVDIARNFGGAPPKLPVWVRNRYGVNQVLGANQTQTATYSPAGNNYAYAVPKHTHAVGGGMVDPVEANRFLPGLVRPFKEAGAFGLKVYIEPSVYEYQGLLVYFAGQAIDLTPYEPSANTKAWIVVGIDPTTNTATAKADTEYALAITMNAAMLNGFDFEGNIYRGAVIYRNGQTAFNTFADFTDVRVFAPGAGAVTTRAVASKTSDYTITAADAVILVDASGGGVTITYPAAAVNGVSYTVKRTDTSANTVTLDGNSNTIDGDATATLYPYESIEAIGDGANWWII